MLYSLKKMLGFAIDAKDGEIGNVKDFYLDDKTWKVRYLVVETGSWLFGRKVLLSPASLQSPDWNKKVFPANLTKDQIKHSPDIDTQQPVSRQKEHDLHSHYSWPIDPGAGIGFMTTGMVGGVIAPDVPFEERISEEVRYHDGNTMSDRGPESEESGNDADKPHLISFKNVKDYRLFAADEEAGEVDDFLMDNDWKIPFVVAKTGSWHSGTELSIATSWIKRLDWRESSIYVDRATDSLQKLPEFEPEHLRDEDYERKLYAPYQDTY